MKCLLIIVCLVISTLAEAGGRGSHNVTFDPNSYGGSWTTINCVGADNTAFDNWRTAAIAANPALAKLRLTGNCVVSADKQITTGIVNAIIWAYGSTITRPYIGGAATGTAYLLNGATIGQTTVTLQTVAQSSNFTVGRWMIVNGLQTQAIDCGFPTNPAFFDYVLITGVNAGTGVITFTPALTSDYLTSWPDTNCGGGKPNTIPLLAAWDTNVQVFGMTVNDTGQTVLTGRTVSLVDTYFGISGMDPTQADSINISYSSLRTSEVDKIVNTVSIYNSFGRFINVQSASVKNLIMQNVTLQDRNPFSSMQGTPYNTTITNSIIPELWIGPGGYGHGNSILVENTKINRPIVSGIQYVTISDTACAGGVISIQKTNPSVTVFVHMGVPGKKYAIGELVFSPFAVPTTAFTINAITDDASNYYWTTDLNCSAAPLCGGVACTKYVAYPAGGAGSIIQRFTPGVNLTQYAAPP